VDPDTKAEFEEMQAKSPVNSVSDIQNFDLASWMAGKPSKSSEQPQAVEEAPREKSGGKRRKA